jgi:hypothetical protein
MYQLPACHQQETDLPLNISISVCRRRASSGKAVATFKAKSKQTNNLVHVGEKFRNSNNNYNKQEEIKDRGPLGTLKRFVTIPRQLKMDHLISHLMLQPSKKMERNWINESNGDNSRWRKCCGVLCSENKTYTVEVTNGVRGLKGSFTYTKC